MNSAIAEHIHGSITRGPPDKSYTAFVFRLQLRHLIPSRIIHLISSLQTPVHHADVPRHTGCHPKNENPALPPSLCYSLYSHTTNPHSFHPIFSHRFIPISKLMHISACATQNSSHTHFHTFGQSPRSVPRHLHSHLTPPRGVAGRSMRQRRRSS
jgi:hypothetical protein